MEQLPEEVTKVQNQLRGLDAQKAKVAERILQVTEELSRPVRDSSAWERVSEGDLATVEIDRRASLREELQLLEGRQRFIEEALSGGRAEFDRLQSRASAKICERELRPREAERAKRRLVLLKELSDIDKESEKDRSGLEVKGIRTGSVPTTFFGLGRWDDPTGNKVTFYRKWIKDNFPEVKEPQQ